jgi:hypothetical protein
MHHPWSLVELKYAQISSVPDPILVWQDEDYQSMTKHLGDPDLI